MNIFGAHYCPRAARARGSMARAWRALPVFYFFGNGQGGHWILPGRAGKTGTGMPIKHHYIIYGHSMELISLQGQPTAMVIGGSTLALSHSGASSKTFLGNLNGAQIQWTEGPPLMTARSAHASALLQHQETTYIVVAGGDGQGLGYTDSVEILKITSTPSEWTAGKFFFVLISLQCI